MLPKKVLVLHNVTLYSIQEQPIVETVTVARETNKHSDSTNNTFPTIQGIPATPNNLKRIANVRPENWQNPPPQSMYNMVVIGGGSAGLVTAIIAASLGAKVALIEKHMMGGDCLNVGCVPSKAVIRSANVMGQIIKAKDFGIEEASGKVNFGDVMERVRRVLADLSPNDSVFRYKELGVDVFLGEGKFSGRNTMEIDGATLNFKKGVIATGSRAVVPPIPGLQESGFLTNETLWNLMEQPKRMAVIGGGPIGCEMTQAFQRLGTQVTLFDAAGHVLIREDADAAEIVQQTMVREGVQLVLNSKVTNVEVINGEKVVHFEMGGEKDKVVVDEILIAVGRAANVENLGLEEAGVEYSRQGVTTNDYLQTTNPDIYAAGDVGMVYKFTHAANAAARIVVQNAFFFGRKKVSDLNMPWCTYTDPEIAHVGMYEHQAKEKGIAVDTYTIHFDDNDRAVADGDEEGFVRVHCKKGTDKILGATIVAPQAGEMLNEITLAMNAGIGLGKLGDVIHPYPTQAEAIARVAGLYTKTRLTPMVRRLFTSWLAWKRR